ncbi:unnamed protein product [Allacma fusca]|uniref:Uncharacterized protein n=1 Tax=Allacma fusca TaxID=39272 RepID=A0A8J2J5T4_9HEXA|nr:unnamed protein product [Allacma fusca]
MASLGSCGITIDPDDIDKTYRFGRAQNDRNIKIKFTKEYTANTNVRGSRELAKKSFEVMEDLTKEKSHNRYLIREFIRNDRAVGKTVTRKGNLAVIEGVKYQAVNGTILQIIQSAAGRPRTRFVHYT